MSRRVEWMAAVRVIEQLTIVMPGDEDWEWLDPDEEQCDPILIIAGDEVTAVEGSLEEVRALGQRIVALVDQLDLGLTTERSNES